MALGEKQMKAICDCQLVVQIPLVCVKFPELCADAVSVIISFCCWIKCNRKTVCAVVGCCVFMLFISLRMHVCVQWARGARVLAAPRVWVFLSAGAARGGRSGERGRSAAPADSRVPNAERLPRPVALSPDSRSQLCALETFQSNFGWIRLSRVTVASNFEPHREVHRSTVCTCTVARL